MSHRAQLDTSKGQWQPETRMYFPLSTATKWKIITAIALIALALALVGGIKASAALYGPGGVLAVAAMIAGAIHTRQLRNAPEEIIYQVVSWNVGTNEDYRNICQMKTAMASGQSYDEAFRTRTNEDYVPKQSELEARVGYFTTVLDNGADFICLQETSDMDDRYIQRITPRGYSCFTYTVREGQHNCSIMYDAKMFTLLSHAEQRSRPKLLALNSPPNTMALFQDNRNGKRICVTSAHLRGFNLNSENLPDAALGQVQVGYDIDTMRDVKADLYIYAGDMNVPRDHALNGRHRFLEDREYNIDTSDTTLTVLDANLKGEDGLPAPVRLDFIYAHGHSFIQGTTSKQDLRNFNERASDHLPVAAKISIRP